MVAKAFPTAEGFGASTRGAYSGSATPEIIHVTNLNDSGEGSLRAALEDPDPRVVVVDVGGYVDVQSAIVVDSPYLTFAGQTAPGDGICVRYASNYAIVDGHQEGVRLDVNAHDIIIRHLRIRNGLTTTMPNQGQCLRILSQNTIIDHCSLTWGHDENVSTGVPTGPPEGAHDVTIQWCITGECLATDGNHGRCFNHTYELDNHLDITDAHNLIMRARFRVPQVSTRQVEVIGNVVYGTSQQGMNVNTRPNNQTLIGHRQRFIKNYLKRINITNTSIAHEINFGPDPPTLDPKPDGTNQIYVFGNIADNSPSGDGFRTSDAQPQTDSIHAIDEPWYTDDDLCTITGLTAPDDVWNGAWNHPEFPVDHDGVDAVDIFDTLCPTTPTVNNIVVGACKPTVDRTDLRMVTYARNGTNPGLVTDPLSETESGFDSRGYAPLASGSPTTLPSDPHEVQGSGYTTLENFINALAGDEINEEPPPEDGPGFGEGTFGAPTQTFDGEITDPIDITYVTVEYTPSVALAASRNNTISRGGLEHRPTLDLDASHESTISKDASP